MIKKFFFFLLGLIYLPFLLITFLGLLAPVIPIAFLPQIQLSPIFLLYLIPLHLIAIAIFFAYSKKWAITALIALLASTLVGLKDYRIHKKEHSIIEEKEGLRVMSYNVFYFQNRAKFVDSAINVIRPLDIDLLCIQEFWNDNLKNGTSTIEYVSQELDLPYYHFATPWQKQGVAILSKYPIVDTDTLFATQSGANYGLITTIQGPRGNLGLGNIHLKSYSLKSTLRRQRGIKDKLKAFFNKASEVVPTQYAYASTTKKYLDSFPYPVILAGDMNAVSNSRMVSIFSKKYTESFVSAGRGIGVTYPLINPLGLRIDYLFNSKELKPLSHHVIRKGYSDHYPIMAEYIYKDE